MYPHVIQFETLMLERARALQLGDEIRAARAAAQAKRPPESGAPKLRYRVVLLRWRNA